VAASCYIHIPFCARICSYCDFYRVLHDPATEQLFVAALVSEMALRLSDERGLPAPLTTLYFGGGTPTTLSEQSWRRIFATVRNYFSFGETSEITVEANPESATEEKLRLLHELGVNRISFGAQSFSSANLQRLGRIHNVEQIALAVNNARWAEIANVSLDLIYGLPDETDSSLDFDLKAATALAPQHLSFYALTLEGEVPLRHQVQRGEVSLPDDDHIAKRYVNAVAFLGDRGYQHYEISNFAQPGHECRHNLAYWEQRDYFAFGPAAVATLNGKRIRNEPDLRTYIKNLSAGRLPPHEIEHLTGGKRLLETIMLSLRLTSGLDTTLLRDNFGYDILIKRADLLAKLREAGDLIVADGFIRLTDQGMFRSDMIASSLCPDSV
jgi:oxygen-independent coproporphyrinogen III oxidase